MVRRGRSSPSGSRLSPNRRLPYSSRKRERDVRDDQLAAKPFNLDADGDCVGARDGSGA